MWLWLSYLFGNRNFYLFFPSIKQISISIIISRSQKSLILLFSQSSSKILFYFLNFIKSWYKDFGVRYISSSPSHYLLDFEKGKVNIFGSRNIDNTFSSQIFTEGIM